MRALRWLGLSCLIGLAVAACAAAGGPTLHVRVSVPMAAPAAPGTACGAADLAATGPISATIPGSTATIYSLARDDADSMPTIGERQVPELGVVVEAILRDPAFPSACRFSFDVPTARDAELYGFRIGGAYLPVPVASRETLQAAGWMADIGVNPQ